MNAFRTMALACLLGSIMIEASWAQPALERVEEEVRGELAPLPPAVGGGYLGITTPEQAEPGGVRINSVVVGSPAEAVDLRAGDIIIAVDEQPVRDNEDLARLVMGKSPGDTLAITVRRGETTQSMVVKLSLPPSRRIALPGMPAPGLPPPAMPPRLPQAARLGITMAPVDEQTQFALGLPQARGAWVIEVVSGSSAQKANLPRGAVIVFADGQRIDTPDDLRRIVANAARGHSFKVSFYHQGQLMERRVTLDENGGDLPDAADANLPPDALTLPVNPAAAPISERGRLAELERRISLLERRLAELEQMLREPPPLDLPPPK